MPLKKQPASHATEKFTCRQRRTKMTKLEAEILKWFSEHYQYLNQTVKELEISKKEVTDIGSFTYFKQTSMNQELVEANWMNIPGPYIESPDLSNGASSLLHIKEGRIDYLEIFAMEDEDNANNIKNYKLTPPL